KVSGPGWKVCADAAACELGEARGCGSVDRACPPASKERMLKLVKALEQALDEDIASLDWMSDVTKKQAHVKVAAILDKIGYPDKWRDYSSLTITRGNALANAFNSSVLNVNYDL